MKAADSNGIFLQAATKKNSTSSVRPLTKLVVYFMIFFFITYIVYSLKLIYPSQIYNHNQQNANIQILTPTGNRNPTPHQNDQIAAPLLINPAVARDSMTIPEQKTQLHHIVFGIAASANLWGNRKNYIKTWWRPEEMRGFVWLDKSNSSTSVGKDDDSSIPPLKVSSDTSKFLYTNKKGDRSAVRLSRIVSETVRLGLEDVRWIVMGDDDTFFVPDNLVRVLRKYDHTQFYYIGSTSESHVQNIRFSYNMAYGGGGIAISYPLAKALEKMQDRCMQRYPQLYGSDDRIQACMAELGVPLTREMGFHQMDLFGNVFGLLAAHPVAPLVSLHHLDVIQPIFPHVNQVKALQRLQLPMKLDSAALMQQSICYDKRRRWTISVSWGYSVQIVRGILNPREMEIPVRTFLNWYRNADETGFTFNTRNLHKNNCQRPFVYTFSNALLNPNNNNTATQYLYYRNQQHKCPWKMPNPSTIHKVQVFKKPNPFLWDKGRRRNCCRVLPSKKKGTLVVDVGECREGEVVEL